MIVTEDRPIDNVQSGARRSCAGKGRKNGNNIITETQSELLNKGEFLSAKKDAKKNYKKPMTVLLHRQK